MSDARYLVVNADDFGMSRGVNRGIVQAHEHGIVTSASLLVLWSGAEEAAAYAAQRPQLGLGLHLDLGEWAWDRDRWRPLYERVPAGDEAAGAAAAEHQLEVFRRLVGRDPTHLDSHQHVHLREPVRGIALALARRLGIPLRGCTPYVRYCGRFYGQTGTGEPAAGLIEVDALLRVLETLEPGLTELGCHPGSNGGSGPGYGAERAVETRTLCDARVRAAIHAAGISLCSFSDPRILT